MGLWDDLKGIASDINNSEFMGGVKEMMKNAATEFIDAGFERSAILQYHREFEQACKERNITDLASVEAINLMVELLERMQVYKRPQGVLNRMYVILLEKNTERNQPVVDGTCTKGCILDRSYCEECRALYKQAKEAIAMINNPEAYMAKFALSNETVEEEELCCRLCGAPMEETEQICEYCGTRKNGFKPLQIKVDSYGEIPSAVEYAARATFAYHNFFAEKTGDYSYRLAQILGEYDVYYKLYAANADMTQVQMTIQEVTQGETAANIKNTFEMVKVPMSETDVYCAAGAKNLPVDVYLRGYLAGDMMNWAGIQAQEAMEARYKQRTQQHEQRMEAMRRQSELQRKQSQEFWERQRSMYRAPQYSGGGGGSSSGGRCCGGCALYNTNTARCARDDSRRSATDSCGWYQWK